MSRSAAQSPTNEPDELPTDPVSDTRMQDVALPCLMPVSAWFPPAAYGGASSKRKEKTPGAAQSISADNFLQFSSFPYLAADAPQRVACAARFRSDRKARTAVNARSPPAVGVIAAQSKDLRCITVGEGLVFVSDGSSAGCYTGISGHQPFSPSIQPTHLNSQSNDIPSELKAYSELFGPGATSVTHLSGGSGILSGDFAPDAMLLATAGLQGSIGLWSVETGHKLVSYSGHTSRTPVWSVKFSPAATYFASGAGDSSAKLWRTDIPCFLRSLPHEEGRHVNKIAWHPNAQVVATATEDEICLWDLLTPKKISGIKRRGVSDLSFSPSGTLLSVISGATGGTKGGLGFSSVCEVFDTVGWSDDAERAKIFTAEGNARKLAWSWPMGPGFKDGLVTGGHGGGHAQMVTVDADGRVKLFDRLHSDKPAVCELPLERRIRPYYAGFTPRNFLIVAGVDNEPVT